MEAAVYGDTVVRDSDLTFNSTISYQAFSVLDSLTADTSRTVWVATLDTTSSDFTFTADLIGTSGGFLDVAVLAADDIWAVGEFYSPDSANPYAYYNAAHWNGGSWDLLKVPTWVGPRQITTRLSTIIANSPTDIWVSSPGNLLRFNGSTWTSMANFDTSSSSYPYGIQAMWADDEGKFYLVGGNGALFRYWNGSWALLQTGTTHELMGVYGGRNPLTQRVEILAVGGDIFVSSTSVLLEITDAQGTPLPKDGIPHLSTLGGCWLSPGRRYWLAGSGYVYGKVDSYTNGRWSPVQGMPFLYYDDVKGDAENNVFAVGDRSTILHFNGRSWRNLSERITATPAQLWGVDVRGDVMAAVGFFQNGALVIRGTRNR
jgi:hypothetical protein